MIEVSILFVSKNRKKELDFTLNRLESLIDKSKHNIFIYLDGCTDGSETLIDSYPWINWVVSKTSIGASKARSELYKLAEGEIFIGLDDDAHPLDSNFIKTTQEVFRANLDVGVIAFNEIRGVFLNDTEAIAKMKPNEKPFYGNDFIGCGFAIRKSTYEATNGFPVWMDIYGEENCVAIEVLANNEKILYNPNIAVNHRVDVKNRLAQGHNYYRFEKQLRNAASYFFVYYPNPIVPILKLLWHNLKVYAFKNSTYFMLYSKVVFSLPFHFMSIFKYRKPVSRNVIDKKKRLSVIQY